MSLEHDANAPSTPRLAVLVCGRDHRLYQPKVGSVLRPGASLEPLVWGLRPEEPKTLPQRVVNCLPHAVISQELAKAVDPQDAADGLRPDRKRVTHILIERSPRRLPSFDHPPQLGGDPISIGGQ